MWYFVIRRPFIREILTGDDFLNVYYLAEVLPFLNSVIIQRRMLSPVRTVRVLAGGDSYERQFFCCVIRMCQSNGRNRKNRALRGCVIARKVLPLARLLQLLVKGGSSKRRAERENAEMSGDEITHMRVPFTGYVCRAWWRWHKNGAYEPEYPWRGRCVTRRPPAGWFRQDRSPLRLHSTGQRDRVILNKIFLGGEMRKRESGKSSWRRTNWRGIKPRRVLDDESRGTAIGGTDNPDCVLQSRPDSYSNAEVHPTTDKLWGLRNRGPLTLRTSFPTKAFSNCDWSECQLPDRSATAQVWSIRVLRAGGVRRARAGTAIKKAW